VANRKERRAAARKKGNDETTSEAIEPDAVLGGAPGGAVPPMGADGIPMPFPDHEEDMLFKTQMKVLNLLLGHWKKGLAIVGAVLFVVLVVGEFAAYQTEEQRGIQAEIADIDRRMPQESPAVAFGIQPPDDSPETKANLEEGARRYEKVAQAGVGSGSVMAWLKAGDAWERAGDAEKAKAAFGQAHAVGATGTLGWSAASQYASLQAESGDIDGAVATLGALDNKVQGLAAEQAKLTVAMLLEDAGRTSESQAALQAFIAQYPGSQLLEQAKDGLTRLGNAG
jgi:tetratricopeptide (TPR) repeat protein